MDTRIVIPMSAAWTFLSNYGHVLVCLARDRDARMRDVADAVGVTERAVQQIVRDLVGQGYLRKEKVGRRNRYQVVGGARFRHELEAHVTLGDFVRLVVDDAAAQDRHLAIAGHDAALPRSGAPVTGGAVPAVIAAPHQRRRSREP